MTLSYFSPQPASGELPNVMPNPFDDEIHPLTKRAAETLQSILLADFGLNSSADVEGRRFGVLVVEDARGQVGFLSAFSGKFQGKWIMPGFVPPAFDCNDQNSQPPAYTDYFLQNALGEKKSISTLWRNEFGKTEISLKGVGDCVGPKMLQYAFIHHLKPLAFAEFWWGLPSQAPFSQGVRHHGQYYPACRGKCEPILAFMLNGLSVAPQKTLGIFSGSDDAPEVIFEDDDLLVIDKPTGLLSVPGKAVKDSVLTRLQRRYPEARGPLLLHRLDLFTSGLLLAAKNEHTYKLLQQQFMQRSIKKRYVAVLSKSLARDQQSDSMPKKGTIALPLRLDIDDRPRQLVCFDFGKAAKTDWEIIETKVTENRKIIRVYFYPVTGRTHQLRLHASHKDGLNAPIVGDALYGQKAGRLMLHAERLTFIHPGTGETVEVNSPVPF